MSSRRIWISTNNMFWTNRWDQCLFFCFSDLQLAYNFWAALYFWLELKKTLLHPFDFSFDYKKMRSVNYFVINCIFIKKICWKFVVRNNSFGEFQFTEILYSFKSKPRQSQYHKIWILDFWSWLRVLILRLSKLKFWKSQPSS